MDRARAAKRNSGVESAVIVYRRTREFMPSQHDEQEMALADGVEFMELLAPESFIDGVLSCEVMRLGNYDSSGRRSIEGTGKKTTLHFDTVIGAVGARVDSGIFSSSGIALNAKGLPVVNADCECSVPGVYAAGDCRAGAATVVKAIADAKAAALDILKKLSLNADFSHNTGASGSSAKNADAKASAKDEEIKDLYLKKGVLVSARKDSADAYRCLSCNTLCEICADVCPNRANVAVEVQGKHQIVHVDRMCNECGNCAAFCPHTGKPFKDKFTVFSCEEDFADSTNPGFLKEGDGVYRIRLENKTVVLHRKGESNIPIEWINMIDAIEKHYGYLIIQ
jgi:putative selenate reductase